MDAPNRRHSSGRRARSSSAKPRPSAFTRTLRRWSEPARPSTRDAEASRNSHFLEKDTGPMPYFPSRDHWDAKPPAELGLAPDAVAAAIDYHTSHETTWRRDFLTASGRYIGVADEPPAPDDVLGPVEPRQGP